MRFFMINIISPLFEKSGTKNFWVRRSILCGLVIIETQRLRQVPQPPARTRAPAEKQKANSRIFFMQTSKEKDVLFFPLFVKSGTKNF